jgi:hypothetical protein
MMLTEEGQHQSETTRPKGEKKFPLTYMATFRQTVIASGISLVPASSELSVASPRLS